MKTKLIYAILMLSTQSYAQMEQIQNGFYAICEPKVNSKKTIQMGFSPSIHVETEEGPFELKNHVSYLYSKTFVHIPGLDSPAGFNIEADRYLEGTSATVEFDEINNEIKINHNEMIKIKDDGMRKNDKTYSFEVVYSNIIKRSDGRIFAATNVKVTKSIGHQRFKNLICELTQFAPLYSSRHSNYKPFQNE